VQEASDEWSEPACGGKDSEHLQADDMETNALPTSQDVSLHPQRPPK
jgi:hypothetical protein